MRRSSAGGADRTFGTSDGTGVHITTGGFRTTAEALTLMLRGGVLVVGTDDVGIPFVAKFHGDGRPDVRMGPGGVRTFHRIGVPIAVAALHDGRIVVAGNTGVVRDSFVSRLKGDLKPPSCGGKAATTVGTRAPDQLVGTRHADVIAGTGGGDTVTGLGKGDVICGGAGKDPLHGGPGADHLYGGRGLDVLRGGAGHDVVRQ